MKRNGWTEREDLMLRKLYPILTNAEIADLLNERCGNGRNALSVGCRARRMGLRKGGA